MSVPRYSEHVEEIVRVPADQPITVTIENPNGDVLVRGTDRSDILIRAEKHGNRSSTLYQETYLAIEADEARISVNPVIPPQAPGSPKVSVDVDLNLDTDFLRELDNMPDFVRDIIGQGRSRDRGERRGRRERSFKVRWNNKDVAYEIEIEVPRALEYRLNVDTASGDVTVDTITGALNVNSASGDVTLKQITGDIEHNSASGDLRLQRGAGQLSSRTASGDARIEKAAFNSFSFQTASGDVHLDAALTGDGPYRIHSASGDARLAVVALNPATGTERSLDLTFHTMSGGARLGSEFAPHGRNRWLVAGAEAGPTLTVETMSGDLTGQVGVSNEARSLGLREPVPAATPAPPAPVTPPVTPPAPVVPTGPSVPPPPASPVAQAGLPASGPAYEAPRVEPEPAPASPLDSADAAMPAADRLALLEAVERGEIDIEEALQRLEDRPGAEPAADADPKPDQPA